MTRYRLTWKFAAVSTRHGNLMSEGKGFSGANSSETSVETSNEAKNTEFTAEMASRNRRLRLIKAKSTCRYAQTQLL